MERLAPDWWMRGVTRSGVGNAPFREASRNAEKGGGAENGSERRAEPRAVKGGAPRYKRRTDARLGLPSFGFSSFRLLLSLVLKLSPLFSLSGPEALRLGFSLSGPEALSRPVVHHLPLLVLRSWSGERPVGGDADGRRSSAGCLVDLRVWTGGAGEGSPAAWEAGTRRDHADGRGWRLDDH